MAEFRDTAPLSKRKRAAKHAAHLCSSPQVYGVRSPPKFMVCILNCSLACEQALLFGQAKRVSRKRASEGPRKGFAARSRVLARLASLAQIGELARRLIAHLNFQLQNLNFTAEFNILHSSFRVHVFGKRFYTCLLAFELNFFI